ncbi:hypothetical protein D9615_003430 [Tricholomella constricta]|uniref:Inositol polyphosphate-related phosphatase domain-containing protein n=1 Tax=Tricholomella constricta TaxID=117010 RepID=A0A8H5M805_9AGAR|nr:hypothetical protein D9615_003430 [Tricholomella constricta]
MLEDAIRALLRSSENLKAVLETVIVRPSYEGSEPTTGVDNAKEKADVSGKRILAVVAHRDDRSGSEEGSVFVCTIRPTENDWSQELEIQHVLPITDDFSTTMAQTRSNTINLAPRSPAEQKTGFSLTIKPGQSSNLDFEHEPMTFRTSSVKELRVLLKECKGFKKIYDDPENITTLRSEARFHWLLPYISKRELPQTFGLVPQDLRLANQPLHTQLSPAAAGSPGDDVADYKLIRDEWIRIRARETSRRARRRLKVRLGTFNVNGKFPSQDLSGWIRSSVPASDVTVNISLPKETSSSSLGEITINPLGAHNAPINALSTGDNISGDSVPLSSPAPTDGQGVDELEYVDSDPDPDILALGFQELDLSTEALIYSTGTAREDAWCLAIFAALGEKGALYEKLSSKQLVGMLLVVIVKKALLPCFTSVDTTAAGAGIMGVMGNKGGTAVRIEFTPSACGASDISSPGSTILTFVNAHLAAFDEMFEKRNSDFQDLSKRMKFASEVLDVTGLTPLPITVYESDVLFWMTLTT